MTVAVSDEATDAMQRWEPFVGVIAAYGEFHPRGVTRFGRFYLKICVQKNDRFHLQTVSIGTAVIT